MTALDPTRTIARILKVNHAGEHGAIRIYGVQIAIARLLCPDVVPKLVEMREHEISHCTRFLAAMPAHNARPCRLLFLWAYGGALLGIATALAGRRGIWLCTEAVEGAVHEHLVEQLNFLKQRDSELRDLIASIQTEEDQHLSMATENLGRKGILAIMTASLIRMMTDILIWMSTSGDSIRLRSDLRSQTGTS